MELNWCFLTWCNIFTLFKCYRFLLNVIRLDLNDYWVINKRILEVWSTTRWKIPECSLDCNKQVSCRHLKRLHLDLKYFLELVKPPLLPGTKLHPDIINYFSLKLITIGMPPWFLQHNSPSPKNKVKREYQTKVLLNYNPVATRIQLRISFFVLVIWIRP